MDPETKLYMAKFRMAEAHRDADQQRAARSLRPVAKPLRNITLVIRRLQSRPASA